MIFFIFWKSDQPWGPKLDGFIMENTPITIAGTYWEFCSSLTLIKKSSQNLQVSAFKSLTTNPGHRTEFSSWFLSMSGAIGKNWRKVWFLKFQNFATIKSKILVDAQARRSRSTKTLGLSKFWSPDTRLMRLTTLWWHALNIVPMVNWASKSFEAQKSDDVWSPEKSILFYWSACEYRTRREAYNTRFTTLTFLGIKISRCLGFKILKCLGFKIHRCLSFKAKIAIFSI